MEALMRDQFESLSSGEAKVTVSAVVDYINGIKDDNLTEKQVEELVKSCDVNGTGSMDMDEFSAAMKKFRRADYDSIDVNNFYEAHFNRMDKDHDGRVSVDQLTDFLLAEDKTGLFSNKDEARNVITEVNSDSSIDLDGFVRVMTNYYKKDFARIDVDASGTISIEEFFDRMDSEMDEAMNFSHDIKKELIKEVFSLVDSDGDCTLSFEEFVKFTQKFSI